MILQICATINLEVEVDDDDYLEAVEDGNLTGFAYENFMDKLGSTSFSDDGIEFEIL